MTHKDFCYWLAGFINAHSGATKNYPDLKGEQVEIIDHYLAKTLSESKKPKLVKPQFPNNENVTYRC